MCEPVTLGAIGIGIGVAGAVAQAKSQSDEGAYRAEVARTNAQLADAAAGDAQVRGARESGYARMAGSQEIAQSRVAYGASGVDGSVGTPARNAGALRMMSELDAQTIRNNAAREAWGYQVEAAKATQEGQFAEFRTKSNVAGTILGGAGDAFKQSRQLYDDSYSGKKRR